MLYPTANGATRVTFPPGFEFWSKFKVTVKSVVNTRVVSTEVVLLTFTTSISDGWNILNAYAKGPVDPLPTNGPAFLVWLEIVIEVLLYSLMIS
jgi:hypothetical protein